MRPFENYNPIVISAYFLSASGILMFSQDLVLLLIGALAAITYFLLRNGRKNFGTHLFSLVLFLVLSLINPLVSHNGVTVLFVLNDAPITLESLAFGVFSAGMIVTVLYFFSSFTQIMTRDRLLYVFSRLSPRLALVLSMGLRYVLLLSGRSKDIKDTQRALGLYKEDNIIDKIKGDLRVFSVLITWALENGIVTADSMAARGYGSQKRSYLALFSFNRSDAFALILIIFCTALTAVGLMLGAIGCTFYPSIVATEVTSLGIFSYIAYGLLAFWPILNETEERLRWRYLQSKI